MFAGINTRRQLLEPNYQQIVYHKLQGCSCILLNPWKGVYQDGKPKEFQWLVEEGARFDNRKTKLRIHEQ